jgi:uncharacterized coiled-coil protein SlyX
MSQEKLPAIVARIDERTAHIQEDVKELKGTVGELKTTVGKHSEDLATIKEKISSTNCQSSSGLSKKQKAGIGGAVAGIITAIIAFLTDYFRH